MRVSASSSRSVLPLPSGAPAESAGGRRVRRECARDGHGAWRVWTRSGGYALMKNELEVLRMRSTVCDCMALKCRMCANAGCSARGSAATETRSPPARTKTVPSPSGGVAGERALPEGPRAASRGMSLIAFGALSLIVARAGVARARRLSSKGFHGSRRAELCTCSVVLSKKATRHYRWPKTRHPSRLSRT